MPKSLRRPALATLALCLFALSPSGPRAQDMPGPQAPPGLDPNPGGASHAKGTARLALITSKPQPGFTEEALDNDVYGVVRLRAILHSSGEVRDIAVIKGLPGGLTEEAIAAARQLKFRPAEMNGRAVSQYIVIEYSFYNYDTGEMAKIVEQPQPEYTEEARRNRVTGKVVLNVYLHRDGTVDSPKVLEGLPHGLSEKAVEAALRLKFIPAEVRGRKVTVVRTLEYTFKLD